MSKDRSGLYNIHGTIFQVIRGVAGDCLSLGDHDGGTRISGPKPWGGGSVIAEFEIDEEYGPVESLEAENAKLRELCRQLRACSLHSACHLCEYAEDACDFDYDMRELGIEVEQ